MSLKLQHLNWSIYLEYDETFYSLKQRHQLVFSTLFLSFLIIFNYIFLFSINGFLNFSLFSMIVFFILNEIIYFISMKF